MSSWGVSIDAKRMRAWLREQTSTEMLYLHIDCAVTFADGEIATHVYVLPKYSLRWAQTRSEDMRSMLRLGCAQTVGDVEAACSSEVTGTDGQKHFVYDFRKHRYLRQNFVTVWVCESEAVIDGHKHFVEGGRTL